MKKICPLLLAGTMAREDPNKVGFNQEQFECREKECAWYDQECDACVILGINPIEA